MICLECLQRSDGLADENNVIFKKEPQKCDDCGQIKKVVYRRYRGTTRFTYLGGGGFASYPKDVSDLDITLQMLVGDMGWDRVRDFPIYIDANEEGKEPLVFGNIEEYDPYLNYCVLRLEVPIIITKP